jgi:hypothetical protein
MLNKDELKNLLKGTVLTVNFKKKDDSTRKMICTLNEEYLPDVTEEITDITKKRSKTESADAIAVWDLEKQAWRSFRIDSIINYETNQ